MRPSVLLAILPAVLAAPSAKRTELAPLHLSPDSKLTDKYIVKFKDGVSMAAVSEASSAMSKEATRHVYEHSFRGFAGHLDEKAFGVLRNHPECTVTQTFPQDTFQWGLSRISSKSPMNSGYVYDDSAGEGTCVYVIDSGLEATHPEFDGRATFVGTAVKGQVNDDEGHGTHVAGTIGGKTYRIAKKTKIYDIKVLDAQGVGQNSDIIAGINYIPKDSATRSCPNGVLVNVSIAGELSRALNDAVAALIKQGYFVGVASGNTNVDVSKISPGSAPTACTVGATDKYDTRFNLSNYGSLIDIMAPGVDIISSFPNKQYRFSGTSMATPHVVGLAAYLATKENKKAGPHLCAQIQNMGFEGVIKGQTRNTVNILAFNGNPGAQ